MKLNPECLRDILLEIENASEMSKLVDLTGSEPRLLKYNINEVKDHVYECYKNRFFEDKTKYSDSLDCPIGNLSTIARNFIENTRSERSWTNTKLAVKRFPSFPLRVLARVAAAFAESVAHDELHSREPRA